MKDIDIVPQNKFPPPPPSPKEKFTLPEYLRARPRAILQRECKSEKRETILEAACRTLSRVTRITRIDIAPQPAFGKAVDVFERAKDEKEGQRYGMPRGQRYGMQDIKRSVSIEYNRWIMAMRSLSAWYANSISTSEALSFECAR